MTLHHPELFQRLHNATILLDTNVFSVASRSKDLAEFVAQLKNSSECAYATIPSVLFEVTNGSSTLEVYNQRVDYVKTLVDAVLPTNFIEKIIDFNVLMAKINGGNKSFTDFQLAACLYQYRHTDIYLMTTDLKAFPSFFDRNFLVTTEQDSGDVINFGLYSLNKANYNKAIEKVLRESGLS